MARIRCLVSPSYHLIPSVSLAPFHFSTYLPRSANHISVRRVTCFPVLQQPTLHDALQQIYQLVLTSPRLLRRFVISAAFDRMHRSSCAHGSFDLVRSSPPPSPYVLWWSRRIRNVTCQIVSACATSASCRLTPWLFHAWKSRWRMLVT